MKLVLVDGSGFIFRAFHALPPMTRPDGTPVNAVFGFANMLARLIKEHTGTHLAVIFDAGRHTFRNRLYADYKAHRPEPPAELVPQFALIREATRAFGVPAIELADWEADDLLAAYARAAREAGGEAIIVSSDKDLMQLVGPGVSMLDPIKNSPIGPAQVREKFGVDPAQVIDVQALMGDSVDNVPGVPGIGPKTACQLITEYGSLDAVLAAAPVMKPSKRRDALLAHAENARLSRELVTLRDDAPLPAPPTEFALKPWDEATLLAFLDENGFRAIRSRLGLSAVAPAGPPAAHGADAPGAHAPDGPAASAGPQIPSAAFGPYECITTEAQLAAWAARIRAHGRFAIDTETDGLDSRHCGLIGIALATAPGEAAYIPLRHNEGEQLAPSLVLDALRPILADPAILKILHHAKFDGEVFTGAGIETLAPIDDTMLISYALDAGRNGHGMDELSELHLGHKPISYDEVTGTGKSRLPFAAIKPDRATAYSAEDADVTLRLWEVLRARLRPERALATYETIERRLVPILTSMQAAGVKVDEADLKRMSGEFGQRMAEIEADLHRLAGREFNVGSPKQLGEILFDEMKLPGGKRMKTGAWGTDASVLEALAEQGHELPTRILDWRQLAKLKSTYADALVGQIDRHTGRVHTSFISAGTTTGRLASTEPNLQNIPIRTAEGARIRRAFIAEPGHVLVSADYSQIELRLLAHVADIPALKASFAAGEDIHARTASEVFGIPMEGMDPLTRRRAKAINFGIIYGISAFGLGRQLGVPPGEARRYIDAYFARYPEIRAYMDRTKAEARAQGYVQTPSGRRLWVSRINDKMPSVRGYAERQAINAPLQGGAAEIIKQAMVRLPDRLAQAGLAARLILQVHDELLIEAPAAEAAAAAAIARETMEAAASLSVPLVVETGTGHNWAEAH